MVIIFKRTEKGVRAKKEKIAQQQCDTQASPAVAIALVTGLLEFPPKARQRSVMDVTFSTYEALLFWEIWKLQLQGPYNVPQVHCACFLKCDIYGQELGHLHGEPSGADWEDFTGAKNVALLLADEEAMAKPQTGSKLWMEQVHCLNNWTYTVQMTAAQYKHCFDPYSASLSLPICKLGQRCLPLMLLKNNHGTFIIVPETGWAPNQ